MTEGLLKTNTSIGGFLDKLQSAGQTTGGLTQFRRGLFSVGNGFKILQNVGKKAIDMFVEFGLEQDKVAAEFRASTGAGHEFDQVITDVALSNVQAGIGLKESAEAVKVLKNAFTDFTYASESQQGVLAANATLLDAIGMSFSTQAKIMQTATQAMGMSAAESQVFLGDIADAAASLGMDINDLGQDFAENANFFVRFGEKGQEVFEELAVAAKALGTDLGTLVEVTEKFKTFDGAAQSVGRLNSILGGPFLNSMDMLNASYEDPIEGIRMLREGFEQAGVAVDDLQGAELEAFASALGLSAAKTKELLGESQEDLEIMRKTEEERKEQAVQAQKVMDQLGSAFKQLLIDGKPIIDIFTQLVGKVGEFAAWMGSAENAMSKFARVGMAVAGIAALIMAPFTLGTSLTVFGALAGSIGIGAVAGAAAGIGAAAGGAAGSGGGATPTSRFAKGGIIQGTSTAIVGEEGPEMVEMPVGTRVTTAPKTEQLTNAITKLISKLDNAGGGSQNISVYIGREKIDEIIIKALNSPAGSAALSPFGNG